jgi:phosphate transport system protein
MVEKATLSAVDALRRRDLRASQAVVAGDRAINAKRFAIENACLSVIATQQPVAQDLRTLTAILEIITELERIGDYAKGIAEIALRLGDQPPVKPLIDVPRMAEKATDMLHRALSAFVARDDRVAAQLPLEDDEVDGLYNQVYRELLTIMMADPKKIDAATYLLWVAHNLERMADRVTNICERTVFLAKGEMSEMDTSSSPS